ncbi:type VI secretion system protein TssA [Sphingomonas sp. NCPPB 2930]
MTTTALDVWLAPCDADEPSGVALDYDPEFMALEKLQQGEPERQYGDVIIAAKEPDWRAVLQAAESLLTRSKDFRVTGALAQALVALRGLPGLVDALELTAALLRDHWTTAYPRLSWEGEDDPVPRIHALAMLADVSGLVANLRAAPFVSHGGMKLSVRDVENVLSMIDVGSPIDREHLMHLLKDCLAVDPTAFDSLHRAAGLAAQCIALCNERFGPEDAPNLLPLTQVLTLLERSVAPLRTTPATFEKPETVGKAYSSADNPIAAVAPAGADEMAQGRWIVRSRRDIVDVIDAVCAYLYEHEPSSPVPVLLQRARQLTGMRYLDIVRTLTPESVATIENLAGRTD